MFIVLELTAQEFYVLIMKENADTERATGPALTESAVTYARTYRNVRYTVTHCSARASAFVDLCHRAASLKDPIVKNSMLVLPPLKAAKLLDQIRERIRYPHYSLRTEESYVYWVCVQ